MSWKNAERMAAKKLTEIHSILKSKGYVDKDANITRNLNQSRNGGFDIAGFLDFAVEVKAYKQCKRYHIRKFWEQAERQAKESNKLPFLMYKDFGKSFQMTFDGVNAIDVKDFTKLIEDLPNVS